MKYKLYDEDTFYEDPIGQILIARGIEEEDLDKWVNAEYDPEIAEAWQDLDNIQEAVDIVKTAIDDKSDIAVIVD